MDKLLNEFTVNRPISETWKVLTDVERIAPCMPGAELKEIEGDIFRGVVKVKLGAIATAFKGEAKFVELDEANQKVVLHGEGRDTTGKGGTRTLSSPPRCTRSVRPRPRSSSRPICGSPARSRSSGGASWATSARSSSRSSRRTWTRCSTRVRARTPARRRPRRPAGKRRPATATRRRPAARPAPAPRGLPRATTRRSTLQQAWELPQPQPQPGPPPQQRPQPRPRPALRPGLGAAAAATAPRPQVRKIEGPASEPIELSGLAGGAILKRALPLVGGLVLLFVIIRRLRRR